ncbi:hypothetical protein pA_gene0068 [Vibrio phage 13VT501A]|nr:hypothetical protein pA_gene0068 [Vibrio phage 13VT501A]
METKFTKGQWACEMPLGSNGFWYVDKKSTQIKSGAICTLYGDNAQNDAHLIAAAPEMYEALEDAADLLFQSQEKECREHGKEIRALLARARGEQA